MFLLMHKTPKIVIKCSIFKGFTFEKENVLFLKHFFNKTKTLKGCTVNRFIYLYKT